MGFPVGYYGLGIPIPRLLLHLAFTLYYIKTLICCALHFVGLGESGEPDNSSWQDFPDMNSPPVSAVSADDKIRDSLPVVTIGTFADKFCTSMSDDLMCAVCLSSFEKEDEVRELCNCRHIFHRICLDKWLDQRQTTCPLCRSSLMPEKILDAASDRLYLKT